MSFKSKIALLMILSAIQFPCAGHTAEEDRELSLIAAEQEDSDEELDEINPALKESISTARLKKLTRKLRNARKNLNRRVRKKKKSTSKNLKTALIKRTIDAKMKRL